MQHLLADWCRQNVSDQDLSDIETKHCFDKFVQETKPNTSTLIDFGRYLFDSYPKNLKLQNLVWIRLQGIDTIPQDRLTNEVAYQVFKQRLKESYSEEVRQALAKGYKVSDPQLQPIPQKKSKFQNVRELVESHLGEDGFKLACLTFMKELPDQDMTIEETLCIMLNLEILNKPFKEETLTVYKGVAIINACISQCHSTQFVNSAGEEIDGSGYQQVMRDYIIDRSKYLVRKLDEGAKKTKLNQSLIKLCSLIASAYENIQDANFLTQSTSELLGAPQKNKGNLSIIHCKNYLSAVRNLLKVLCDLFKKKHPALIKILEKFDQELISLQAHFNVIPSAENIFQDYNKMTLLHFKLNEELEKYYLKIDSSEDLHWLHLDRNQDLSAFKALISQPIRCFQRHLKQALNEMVILSDVQKNRLLPHAANLVASLTHLYENRMLLAKTVDSFRQIAQDKRFWHASGPSIHKTITGFGISSKRTKMSTLITILKESSDIHTAKSGNLLCGVATLKMAIPDYLEDFLVESLGDAEEAIEALINSANLLIGLDGHPLFSQLKKNLLEGEKTIQAFLETAAWVKNYFSAQKIVWESPFFEEIKTKAEAVVKKSKTSSKKAKNKNHRNTPVYKREDNNIPSVQLLPKGSLKDDQKSEEIPAVQSKKAEDPKPKEEIVLQPPQLSFEESSSSEDEPQYAVPSATEIWKAKVEQLRSMRQMARGLKQIGQVLPEQIQESNMNNSVQEVLCGILRRKPAAELSLLRKGKLSEILKELNNDGWVLNRTTGDHHIYTHPCLVGQVVIPYSSESEQLKRGTFNSIAKSAGWMD